MQRKTATPKKQSTRKPSARQGEGLRLSNTARKLKAQLDRAERAKSQAETAIEEARDGLLSLHRAACKRFGREIPADAALLDVLDSITIEKGDVWRWHGIRNNNGLATVRRFGNVRRNGTESSVVRYLAIQFGVIREDEWGLLYPTDGDKDDVNPWHRELRATDLPVGNANRFDFTNALGDHL